MTTLAFDKPVFICSDCNRLNIVDSELKRGLTGRESCCEPGTMEYETVHYEFCAACNKVHFFHITWETDKGIEELHFDDGEEWTNLDYFRDDVKRSERF